MINYQAKKLFNGCVSVRDYVVAQCLREQRGLRVHYLGKVMTVTFTRLCQSGSLFHNRRFDSQFKADQSYTLIDIPWRPDNLLALPQRITSSEVQLTFA